MDQKGSAAMLAIKMSAGVAPEVNLRNPFHTVETTLKQGIYHGFETWDRCHQKSKTGLAVTPQKKNWCPAKSIFVKKESSSNIHSLHEYQRNLTNATIEFFTVRNFWQNLADLPNENKSGEIQQIREI